MALVVHGDDFTALGPESGLDRYEKGMQTTVDDDVRGRLGHGKAYVQQVKILNRILRITPTGLSYEADPRHAELLAKLMGLDDCKKVATPGVKKAFTDDVMDLPISDECDGISSIDARMPQIEFDLGNVETLDVVPYSKIYGCHPSKFVF